MDKKYEESIDKKFYSYIGEFFDSWNMHSLDDDISFSIGNNKTSYLINLVNKNIKLRNNITYNSSLTSI
jgi:hypothetical protein